uniref:Uncharacterized protein n=1 Tax=Prasinoderma singulare TaxID=676789 RepID=A0A7S3BIY2_9VIRI
MVSISIYLKTSARAAAAGAVLGAVAGSARRPKVAPRRADSTTASALINGDDAYASQHTYTYEAEELSRDVDLVLRRVHERRQRVDDAKRDKDFNERIVKLQVLHRVLKDADEVFEDTATTTAAGVSVIPLDKLCGACERVFASTVDAIAVPEDSHHERRMLAMLRRMRPRDAHLGSAQFGCTLEEFEELCAELVERAPLQA